MRTLWPVCLAAVVVIAAGCGDDDDVSMLEANTPSASPAAEPTTAGGDDVPDGTAAAEFDRDVEIRWTSEGGPGEVDAGVLVVPMDYDDPDAGTFELYVARRNADDPEQRIGSLLANPGGPGFGGSDYAYNAAALFGPDLLARFDLVGWDPRGTGSSEPAIDCIDDYDRYFAGSTTDDEDEARTEAIELSEEFTDHCLANGGEHLRHVGTNNSARDMDAIRRALGEEQISYLGFSYGSELGGVWATLFPETVRAAVLDGAADPTADLTEGSRLQYAAFEASLETFLARCSADSDCAFHNDGDAEAAFDELMDELDEDPIEAQPDRPLVNRTVALQGVVRAMYSEAFWGALAEGLADAQQGDATSLLAFYDDYYQRRGDGTWGNELEAFQVISCADTTERPSVEQADADAAELARVAPRLASDQRGGSYFCTFFPNAGDPRIDITGAGAGPIVVVGTTGDPATPLEGSRMMADALEGGVLLEVDADEHTGYRVNACSMETVEAYLIDLDVPAEGATC